MFPTLIPFICHERKQLKLVNHQFLFQFIFHDPNKNNDDINYIGHHCYRNICLCNYQTIIRGHEEIEQIIPVMDNNNAFCEVIDFAISDNYCDVLVLLTAEGVSSLLVQFVGCPLRSVTLWYFINKVLNINHPTIPLLNVR